MKIPFFGKKKDKDVHTEELTAYLSSILRHAIVMERADAAEEPPIGTSKIGGKPHLPMGFSFPYYEGADYEGNRGHRENRPLSFLAQINLSEVAAYDKSRLLPRRGFLYFFYDTITQPWGFDPEDDGGARVYYCNVTADDLFEMDLPRDLHADARVPLQLLHFRNKQELPDFEELFDLTDVDRFGEDLDWEAYAEVAQGMLREDAASDEDADDLSDEESYDMDCKLLGYADLIQGSMLEEVAMVTSGRSCGNAKAYKERTEEQQQNDLETAREWILLAQFDSLSDEIMFGDCGCIYFYIRKEDLAARRFDRVWLCLQCG